MNSSLVSSENLQNKKAIYLDNLSTLFQVISRCLSEAEKTVIVSNSQNVVEMRLDNMGKYLCQLRQLRNRMTGVSNYTDFDQITFHRFMTRLFQTTSLIKEGYRHKKLEVFNVLDSFLRQLQKGIHNFNQKKNLELFIIIIQQNLLCFCDKIQNLLIKTDEFNDEMISVDKRKILFSQNMSKQSKEIEGTRIDSLFLNKLNYSSIQEQIKGKLSTKNNKILLLNRNHFQLYQGMDLHYQFYKTNYLNTKKNADKTIKSCIERNRLLSKTMYQFSESFQLHLKKNDKRVKREKKELSSLSEKKDKRLLGKATSRFTQTVLERKQKKYKSCDQQELKTIASQITPHTTNNRKQFITIFSKPYRMKHALITFTKKERPKQNNSNFFKRLFSTKKVNEIQSFRMLKTVESQKLSQKSIFYNKTIEEKQSHNNNICQLASKYSNLRYKESLLEQKIKEMYSHKSQSRLTLTQLNWRQFEAFYKTDIKENQLKRDLFLKRSEKYKIGSNLKSLPTFIINQDFREKKYEKISE